MRLNSLFRQQVPPRNLINLARKYYTNATINPLLKNSSSIGLLQPSPAYSLEPTIKNPDIRRLQQDQRIVIPLKRTRKEYLRSYPQALVVAGIGPDTALEIKKKRRRRRFITLSAILAATVAVACSGGGNTAQFTVSASKSINPDVMKTIEAVGSQEEEENESEIRRASIFKPVEVHTVAETRTQEPSETKTYHSSISKTIDETIFNTLGEKKKSTDESTESQQKKRTNSNAKEDHLGGDEHDGIEHCKKDICDSSADVTKQRNEDESDKVTSSNTGRTIIEDRNEKVTSSNAVKANVEKGGKRHTVNNRPLEKFIRNIAKSARNELGHDAESIAL